MHLNMRLELIYVHIVQAATLILPRIDIVPFALMYMDKIRMTLKWLVVMFVKGNEFFLFIYTKLNLHPLDGFMFNAILI